MDPDGEPPDSSNGYDDSIAEIDALLALSPDDEELRNLRSSLVATLTTNEASEDHGDELEIDGDVGEEDQTPGLAMEPGTSCLVAFGPIEVPLPRLRSCLVLLPALIMDVVGDDEALVHLLCPLDEGGSERTIPVSELLPRETADAATSERGEFAAAKAFNGQWKLVRVVETRHSGREVLVEAVLAPGNGERAQTWTVGNDGIVPVTVVPLDDDDGEEDESYEGSGFDVEMRARDRMPTDLSDDSDNSSETDFPTSTASGAPSGFASWEQHTRGIASKLLAAMGFSPGLGLGKAGQGRVEPVEAVRVAEKRGLGFEGSKRATKRAKKNAGKAKVEEKPPDVFDFLNGALRRSAGSQGSGPGRAGTPWSQRTASPNPSVSSDSKKKAKSAPELLAISDRRNQLAPLLARARSRFSANAREPTLQRHYAEEIKQIEAELGVLAARERVVLQREAGEKMRKGAVKF